jgi:hypothetical protein
VKILYTRVSDIILSFNTDVMHKSIRLFMLRIDIVSGHSCVLRNTHVGNKINYVIGALRITELTFMGNLRRPAQCRDLHKIFAPLSCPRDLRKVIKLLSAFEYIGVTNFLKGISLNIPKEIYIFLDHFSLL